jgi:hypothetical protein
MPSFTFPVTVILGMEISFVEEDALYRGRVTIGVRHAFGQHTQEIEFSGPSWAVVAAYITQLLVDVAAGAGASILGEP